MSDPRTTRSPDLERALDLAWHDALSLGVGFVMLTSDGCQHIPAEAVTIDRSKLSEAPDAES